MKLIDIAREFLEVVTSELDPYTSKNGIIKQEGTKKISLLTPSHIQFAKYGRGPGKQPPIDPIIKWVEQEGIVRDGNSVEGTAWAIAKSIGKNGTKNYKPNAPNALEEAITNNFVEYNRKMAEMLSIEINDELQIMYTQTIAPKEQVIKI